MRRGLPASGAKLSARLKQARGLHHNGNRGAMHPSAAFRRPLAGQRAPTETGAVSADTFKAAPARLAAGRRACWWKPAERTLADPVRVTVEGSVLVNDTRDMFGASRSGAPLQNSHTFANTAT